MYLLLLFSTHHIIKTLMEFIFFEEKKEKEAEKDKRVRGGKTKPNLTETKSNLKCCTNLLK